MGRLYASFFGNICYHDDWQEQRRRAVGHLHWEQWAAAKRAGSRPNNGNGVDEEREAEAELKKKAQDEAFAAWAREKDKLLRARRRKVSSSGRQIRRTVSIVDCREAG